MLEAEILGRNKGEGSLNKYEEDVAISFYDRGKKKRGCEKVVTC